MQQIFCYKELNMAKAKKTNIGEPTERLLWESTDKLRKNIDAAKSKHNEGHLINRRTRGLLSVDIQKIASTYHEWRKVICRITCNNRGRKMSDNNPSVTMEVVRCFIQ